MSYQNNENLNKEGHRDPVIGVYQANIIPKGPEELIQIQTVVPIPKDIQLKAPISDTLSNPSNSELISDTGTALNIHSDEKQYLETQISKNDLTKEAAKIESSAPILFSPLPKRLLEKDQTLKLALVRRMGMLVNDQQIQAIYKAINENKELVKIRRIYEGKPSEMTPRTFKGSKVPSELEKKLELEFSIIVTEKREAIALFRGKNYKIDAGGFGEVIYGQLISEDKNRHGKWVAIKKQSYQFDPELLDIYDKLMINKKALKTRDEEYFIAKSAQYRKVQNSLDEISTLKGKIALSENEKAIEKHVETMLATKRDEIKNKEIQLEKIKDNSNPEVLERLKKEIEALKVELMNLPEATKTRIKNWANQQKELLNLKEAQLKQDQIENEALKVKPKDLVELEQEKIFLEDKKEKLIQKYIDPKIKELARLQKDLESMPDKKNSLNEEIEGLKAEIENYKTGGKYYNRKDQIKNEEMMLENIGDLIGSATRQSGEKRKYYQIVTLFDGYSLLSHTIEDAPFKNPERYLNDPMERLEVAVLMLQAVKELHELKNMIHVDLKPENMIYLPHQIPKEIKLIDMGQAVKLSQGKTRALPIGGGTPGYSSIELQQRRQVTKATDIYSLGIILRDDLLQERNINDPIHKKIAALIENMTQDAPEKRMDINKALEQMQAIFLEYKETQAKKQSINP